METLLLFCCKSCLKGDDNKEYYEVLSLSHSASSDDIKKAYKKISLSLHPDKLAQRGIEITSEHKQQFLKVKEAHDVLSDPRKRKLYDELGASGLKLIESPTEVNPLDIIKNFQKNNTDRNVMFLAILIFFGSLFVLPVLFSLKCDGDIDNVPWVALWTPMWIVDALLLISAFALFTLDGKKSNDENEEEDNKANIPLLFKLNNFISTILFVLIQIFVLIRLDQKISWNWFEVFIPWFLYDGLWILNYFPSCIAVIKKPDFDSISRNLVNANDVENNNDINDEILLEKFKLETVYFDLILNQIDSQKKVFYLLVRIWQAIFLALKLDGTVDWNWGLVFLPIWVYLFMEYVYIYLYRSWGYLKVKEINVSDDENINPIDALHYKQATDLINISTTTCLVTIIPIYLAILLVTRLQVSSFSTFIILLPVFIILGCSCCCIFCGIFSLAVVDTDELEKAYKDADSYNNNSPNKEKSSDYEPPIVPEVIGSAVSSAYGTFATSNEVESTANPTTSLVVESKEEVSTTSVLVEID